MTGEARSIDGLPSGSSEGSGRAPVKSALFGGTFDPPHLGHLILAERVVDELGLERLVFMPCGVPPHKHADTVSAGHHRMRMLELATRSQPRFTVSDIELERAGESYTIRTVRQLKESGIDEVMLVIGADSLVDLPNWMEPEALIEESSLVVVGRPGFDIDAATAEVRRAARRVECPLIDISSTDVRARVAAGRSIRYLVPEPVEDYIARHGLYR